MSDYVKRGPGRPPKPREPDWAEFADHVRSIAEHTVRVRYPYSRIPAGLLTETVIIDTIYRGIPVLDADRVELMDAKGIWRDYP